MPWPEDTKKPKGGQTKEEGKPGLVTQLTGRDDGLGPRKGEERRLDIAPMVSMELAEPMNAS